MTAKRRQSSYRWGHAAEFLCCAWLVLKGYRIVHRRHKTPLGEIDIVAARDKQLVFVEVKARGDIASGLEANTRTQQGRIMRAAQHVMADARYHSYTMRFDMMVARPWRLPYHMKDAWRP